MTEGKNLVELKKEIADVIHDIKQAKLDRQDINAEIQAAREKLAARGIPKAALDMAMRYLEWDEPKREGFDVAYALVREAAGAPLQEDLFQAADRLAKDGLPGEDGKEAGEKPGPDAGAIEKIFRSEDAEKVKGKTVHQPTGQHQGAIN